jgi:predicted ArsR family transcriptional regulator
MKPGNARIAMLYVLQSGFIGAAHEVAQQSGIPLRQARNTLQNLRRDGHVFTHHKPNSKSTRVGRPHARYGAAKWRLEASPIDLLVATLQAWRQAPEQQA